MKVKEFKGEYEDSIHLCQRHSVAELGMNADE